MGFILTVDEMHEVLALVSGCERSSCSVDATDTHDVVGQLRKDSLALFFRQWAHCERSNFSNCEAGGGSGRCERAAKVAASPASKKVGDRALDLLTTTCILNTARRGDVVLDQHPTLSKPTTCSQILQNPSRANARTICSSLQSAMLSQIISMA